MNKEQASHNTPPAEEDRGERVMNDDQMKALHEAVEDGHLRVSVSVGVGSPVATIGTRELLELVHAGQRLLSSPRVEETWKPIETAPKDGSYIDVWVAGEFPRRVVDVQWREPSESEWWVHGGDELKTPRKAWFDPFGPLGKNSKPTHWRREPNPPALSPQGE